MNVVSLRPKSSTEDPVEDMEEGGCALIRVPLCACRMVLIA